MRSDMRKLLCERERRGSSARSYKTGMKMLCPDPDKDYEFPMRAKSCMGAREAGCHRDDKSLSDFLSPLRGFIRKSVGRKWDDVYSEICAGLDRRSVSGLHIFQHLDWEVEVDTYLGEDGNVYSGPYVPPSHRRQHGGLAGYFVHPVTGILCYVPKKSWRYKYRSASGKYGPILHWIDKPNSAYVKIDGLWFKVDYRISENPPAEVFYPESHGPRLWRGPNQPDYKTKSFFPSHWMDFHEKVWLEAGNKKSLNKKEIRDLKASMGVATKLL